MSTDYVDSLTDDRPIAYPVPATHLDGWSVESELIEGEFSEATIWQILQDILPILQSLHDRHEIHGDIRPANIIRQRCDHRLVLIYNNATTISTPLSPTSKSSANSTGSVEYAAPEQLYGETNQSSDLYSLGMTCLHLLTQLSPFDLIDRRANATWQDYLSQPISPSLQAILNKMIDPSPQKRYPSVATVLQDVEILFPLTIDAWEGLSAATIATISTVITNACVQSATIFDPTTQHWYCLSREPKMSDATQKIASFLSSRQAAATVPHVKLELRDRLTLSQLVLRSLMAGIGTVVGCLAGFCLFTCLSIIALTLSTPPQSSSFPATQSPIPAPQVPKRPLPTL